MKVGEEVHSPRSVHDPSVVGLIGEAPVLDEAVVVAVPPAGAPQQRHARAVHVREVSRRRPRGTALLLAGRVRGKGGRGGGRGVAGRRRLTAPVQQAEYVGDTLRRRASPAGRRAQLLSGHVERGGAGRVRCPGGLLRRPRVEVVLRAVPHVVYVRQRLVPVLREGRGVRLQLPVVTYHLQDEFWVQILPVAHVVDIVRVNVRERKVIWNSNKQTVNIIQFFT